MLRHPEVCNPQWVDLGVQGSRHRLESQRPRRPHSISTQSAQGFLDDPGVVLPEPPGFIDARRPAPPAAVHWEVPRHTRFVTAMPLTATGKPQRFRMRERTMEELGVASD